MHLQVLQTFSLKIKNINSCFSLFKDLTINECITQFTQSSQSLTQTTIQTEVLMYQNESAAFPYQIFFRTYRPSVISKSMYVIFGFQNNLKSWALDNISVIDTTEQKEMFTDGGFESNYLTQSYSQCILSNTRSSTSDILFDIPYDGDFYYNDQTFGGMNYLSQQINIIGGRYYNISFYLENRGYINNSFILLVAY
jgi:hypothetical protein